MAKTEIVIARILNKISQIRRSPKDIVGIDITETQIAVVVLSTAPEPVVKDFVVQKLPETYRDEELSKIIEDIFTKKRLFKKDAWLNIDLPTRNLNFARISLPVMPASEIVNAIKWGLKDKTALDVKESRLSYEVIDEVQRENGAKNLNIMAVLVENNAIDRILNVFKKAGITLSGISATPFSISNALRTDKELGGKKEPILICHIGIEYSYIFVYVKGKVAFVRQIPLSLTSFLSAMTGVIASDKGRVELTMPDAKKIIEEFGIPKETDTILGGKIASGQITAMVRPVIERFIGELSRSIDYYQREFRSGKVERVLLTGGGSAIRNLCDFISKGLSLEIGYLKVPKDLNCQIGFGAALGGIQNECANLLPEELRHDKQVEIKKTTLRLSTVIVLSLLLFSLLTVTIQIGNYKKQLGLLQNQKLILTDLKEMQNKINSREAIACSMRAKEVPVGTILKELSIMTPGNIAFLKFSLNQNERILRIRGRILSRPQAVQGALSDFIEALEKAAFFKEASLSNAQIERSANEGISVFDINCVLNN